MRLLETRSALRNAGGSVLTSLYQWTTPSGSSPGSMTPLRAVDALRCAAAWCNAGLLRAEVVGQSTLLSTVACSSLARGNEGSHAALAEMAAEALCAALHPTPRYQGEGGDDPAFVLSAFAAEIRPRIAMHALSRPVASVACSSALLSVPRCPPPSRRSSPMQTVTRATRFTETTPPTET